LRFAEIQSFWGSVGVYEWGQQTPQDHNEPVLFNQRSMFYTAWNMGVGGGKCHAWGQQLQTPNKKNREKYFSGKCHEKFGKFRANIM